MNLAQGDTLETGKDSWAVLYIDDDKEVKIGEKTRISMSELAGSIKNGNDSTGIKLWTGKVFTKIKKKLNIRLKFEIKPPTAVAGARGTQFYVGQVGGSTEIAVLEGTVAATSYIPTTKPGGTTVQQQVAIYMLVWLTRTKIGLQVKTLLTAGMLQQMEAGAMQVL